MRERISGTWVAFFLMTCGLIVLMFGVRPELQPTPDRERAPGPTIELIGHVITWTSATFLTVRLARSTRTQLRRPEY